MCVCLYVAFLASVIVTSCAVYWWSHSSPLQIPVGACTPTCTITYTQTFTYFSYIHTPNYTFSHSSITCCSFLPPIKNVSLNSPSSLCVHTHTQKNTHSFSFPSNINTSSPFSVHAGGVVTSRTLYSRKRPFVSHILYNNIII